MYRVPQADSRHKAKLLACEQEADNEFFGSYPRRSCYPRHNGGGRYTIVRRIAPGVYLRLAYVSAYPLHLTCFTSSGALQLWRQLARNHDRGRAT